MKEGVNSVRMSGYLKYPKLTTTANGYPKFTGKIAIPISYERAGEKVDTQVYHNIIGWGPVAEGLGEMLAETPIEIDGALNTRKYDGRCKHCKGTDTKYWTEVQVNNFIILTE